MIALLQGYQKNDGQYDNIILYQATQIYKEKLKQNMSHNLTKDKKATLKTSEIYTRCIMSF